MPERDKFKYVIFKANAQRVFVERVMQKSGLGARELAGKLGVSGRTVRDWRREACTMPFFALQKLATIAEISHPQNITLQDRYAHTRAAGTLGGKAFMEKYGHVGGDEQKRKIAWSKWWHERGKNQKHPILYQRKPIKYPQRSAKLAEFVGILMGDGGISARQVVVTLDSETDQEFAVYYRKLCKELFGVTPSRVAIKNCRAVNLIVSRTDLVQRCHRLGLPIGHKIRQGLDMPKWIKEKPEYARACLRGLVDTDGSVFTHRYRVGGKQYKYKKLDFCTLSKPLLQSAYATFYANGMHPYVSQGKKLRLESKKDIKQYFKVIGTSNPKHLKRYQS